MFLSQVWTFIGRNTRHQKYNYRQLWQYVALAFNSVDTHRLAEVGAERMCAEWILKNGGAIRTLEEANILIDQYNALPPENVKFHVKEVDATKATIMKVGLEHFKGCYNIDKVILHECLYLEEDGLDGIVHLVDSLQTLEISACHNITSNGLLVLGKLKKLRYLNISDMGNIRDLQATRIKLQEMLPQCTITSN